MRKLITIATVCLLALAVWGVAANFYSVSSSVVTSGPQKGALKVSWDERGLGNGDINYTLTANASAVFACINGGGNHPKATNKETINSEVSAGGTFEAKNGRIIASLTAGPPSAGSFSCPSGQSLVLASVEYTNIVLTDTTNNSSVNVADTSFTFFTF